MTKLQNYLEVLSGCRFCPMCKPASETGRLLHIESYSTRARGMMLWSIASGQDQWTERKAEIVFQSTRDGISESWCVSHAPVSEYVLTARQEIWDKGLVPKPVMAAVDRQGPLISEPGPDADGVFLAGEFADIGDLEGARAAAERLGVGLVFALTGFTAHSLGASDTATAQAEKTAELVADAGRVIADGPQTEYMLRRIWPEFGLSTPPTVQGIASAFLALIEQGALSLPRLSSTPTLFLDSRAATYLADTLAESKAIDPSFSGPEEALGTGASYEDPRQLLEILGVDRVEIRWSRSLSRSCGSDDGLWATYPDLSQGLARESVAAARMAGAARIAVDSPVSKVVLTQAADDEVEVVWVGDQLATG